MLYNASSATEIFIANSLLGLGVGLMESPIITYIGEIWCVKVTNWSFYFALFDPKKWSISQNFMRWIRIHVVYKIDKLDIKIKFKFFSFTQSAFSSWCNDCLFGDNWNSWNVICVCFKYFNAMANGCTRLYVRANFDCDCSLFRKWLKISMDLFQLRIKFQLPNGFFSFRFLKRHYGCYPRIERFKRKDRCVGYVVGYAKKRFLKNSVRFSATVNVQNRVPFALNKTENVIIRCQQWLKNYEN